MQQTECFTNPSPTSDPILDFADALNFGELHCKFDPLTGLSAIVAIHNTNLGPGLGGCRYKTYASFKDAAYDAMRLAQGMSYKSAMAGMALGGAKAVIIKNSNQVNRKALFEKFGEFVNSLNGRYVTAVDSGTYPQDMDIVSAVTSYVTSQQGEDPSPFTAKGVVQAMLATVKSTLGRDDLAGLTIAIQGIGNVGLYLVQELLARDAQIILSDISAEAIEKARSLGKVQVVHPNEIHMQYCDIFSPCALGAVFNNATISQLNCKMIVGAANNQLAAPEHGTLLFEKGIVYTPDYIANAGGVIQAGAQFLKKDRDFVKQKVSDIYLTTLEILEQAKTQAAAPEIIADKLAKERIDNISGKNL